MLCPKQNPRVWDNLKIKILITHFSIRLSLESQAKIRDKASTYELGRNSYCEKFAQQREMPEVEKASKNDKASALTDKP
jgi:hypothetical protein